MAFSSLAVTKLRFIPKQCTILYASVRNSHMPSALSRIEDGVIKDYNPDGVTLIRVDWCPGRPQIGFGLNSEKIYFDKTDFPYPAVRYKVETPEIKALRDKEKGDWKKLTLQEKKALYRASFRQTFAEFDAPDPRWKSTIGWYFFWHGVCMWWAMFIYWLLGVRENTRQGSLSLEARQAEMQRYIAMRWEYATGIGSHWDYEKDDWKPEYKAKYERPQ